MLQRIAASTFLGKRALSSLVTNNGARSIASTIASSDQFIKCSKSCSSFKLPMRFSTSAMIIPEPAMLCRQCEQTKDGVACTTLGVCGKTPETSAIQDALLQVIKSVAHWCVAAREAGGTSEELNAANVWTLRAGFSTMTNVNFSEERIAEYIREGMALKRNVLEPLVHSKNGKVPTGFVAELNLSPELSLDELEEFGGSVGVFHREKEMNDADAFSLNEIATYGSKGVMAYAAHCHQLGYIEDEVMIGLHQVFVKLSSNDPDIEGLLETALKVGELNAKTLAMLDEAHCSNFGAPTPTEVRTTAMKGKAILVSGHDIKDLYCLLEQTEGTGIKVYTHGEMLPAHSYPKLKRFKHLAGNYGTAWQNQKFEFATFPGPIVVTTNCIIEPRRMYKNRIFTMNEVGFPGVAHIGEDRDFTPVLEEAQKAKGFPRTIEPARYHTVGFNHRAVLPLAKQVIEAAQSGVLSRIFLIGGCDGSEWDRSYFTDLAEATPDDSLILTLGCAKNRIIGSEKLKHATLANGMPRIMDMGQCNDSYSAIVVATELAKALDCTVNDLPLSLALSHLEQKAAAVLLTLLHLGVKNIRLGPKMPAYITPNVMNILVQKFNLMPTIDANQDLKAMMQGN